MIKLPSFFKAKLSTSMYANICHRVDALCLGFGIGLALSSAVFGAAVAGACWWLGVDGIMYDLAAKDLIIQNTLLNPEPAIRQHMEGLEMLINAFSQGALKAIFIGVFLGLCGAVFPNLWIKQRHETTN